ncbi:MAG: hypothetical protein MR906_01305 [Clostridium sp.]|nr:hypothetical protein [Clostridium sp.]
MTYEEAVEYITERYVTMSMCLTLDECIKHNKAISMAIKALEKQIPKKPRETRCALMCASCGHKITEKGCKKLNRSYCKKCGQAIDWEVSE